MVASPAPTAVTTPFSSTVATFSSEDSISTVAFSGDTAQVIWAVSPIASVVLSIAASKEVATTQFSSLVKETEYFTFTFLFFLPFAFAVARTLIVSSFPTSLCVTTNGSPSASLAFSEPILTTAPFFTPFALPSSPSTKAKASGSVAFAG